MHAPETTARCPACRSLKADLAEAREALEVLRGSLAWHQEKLAHARAANEALRAQLREAGERLPPPCGCDLPGRDGCPLHAAGLSGGV